MKTVVLVASLMLCLLLAGSAFAGLDDGMLGYWPMDEGSGVGVSDQSGNGNDGTFRGSPSWISGPVGGALDFPTPKGDDDMVVVPDDPSLDGYATNNAYSVSFWLNNDGVDSQWMFPLAKDWYGNGYENPYLSVQVSGWEDKGIGTCSLGGQYYTRQGTHDGTWHHWTVTYQGNSPDVPTVSIYRDGALIDRALWDGSWLETVDFQRYESGTTPLGVNDIPLTIGGAIQTSDDGSDPCTWIWTGSSLDGALDEMCFWDRALSEDEIAKVYALGDAGMRLLDIERAHNPVPADFAVDVPTDQVLSWDNAVEDPCTVKAVGTVTDYKVYMSTATDPNLVLKTTIPVANPAEYDPGTLDRDGHYFWRVDLVRDGDSDIVGELWSFKAVLANPVFNPALPADVLVAQGDDAVFTVEVTNPWTGDSTGMTYQWYESPSTALSDGADYSGATTDTLTVVDVEPGDVGNYFCRVTITSSGNVGDSRAALLLPEMLIGHWKLDGNANDELGINDGTEVNDPNWVAGGIDGGGALLLNWPSTDAGPHLDLVGSADYLHSMVGDEISVCIWAKTDAPDAWEGIWSKGSNWQLYRNSKNVVWEAAGGTSFGFDDFDDGTWHQYVATYDRIERRLYIDGELVISTASTGAIVETAGMDPVIGAWRSGAGAAGSWGYNGELDDARIYNYALSPIQVASLYQAVSGSTETIIAGLPEYDFNGDGITNMLDFAVFAATWLDCTLVPDCITDVPQ